MACLVLAVAPSRADAQVTISWAGKLDSNNAFVTDADKATGRPDGVIAHIGNSQGAGSAIYSEFGNTFDTFSVFDLATKLGAGIPGLSGLPTRMLSTFTCSKRTD